MKKIVLLVLSLPLFNILQAQPKKDTAKAKNTIALLGTYHFGNPNLDHFNVKSDDVLSEKRQKEIVALTQMLAKYKPTHIALEFNALDTTMDARYQRYRKGEYTLNNNELEQLGFRLAKMLGHEHVYPVDAPDIQLNFDPGPLGEEFGPLLEQLGKEGNQVMAEINGWLEKYSIGQVLAQLNSPAMNQKNINLYYQYLLPIGKEKDQPGVEAITRWYKRNLMILHYIQKLTEEKNGQRVLVIFGQGHTAILEQFLQYSTIYKKEDIQKYLPPVLNPASSKKVR